MAKARVDVTPPLFGTAARAPSAPTCRCRYVALVGEERRGLVARADELELNPSSFFPRRYCLPA